MGLETETQGPAVHDMTDTAEEAEGIEGDQKHDSRSSEEKDKDRHAGSLSGKHTEEKEVPRNQKRTHMHRHMHTHTHGHLLNFRSYLHPHERNLTTEDAIAWILEHTPSSFQVRLDLFLVV
jgi:hypothetical protein